MRLEVLVVASGDVQIFPLNRPKIIIGSGEVCDIVIGSEGVSRKHVIITTENDQYFVADQGSTNGTYINEERLQPGKRVEFTSFFPVRLGENILLTLLSDEESDGLDFSEFNFKKEPTASFTNPNIDKTDSTRAISLNELSGMKTQTLVKKRNDIQKKKISEIPPPTSRSSDKTRMFFVKLAAFFIVGAAAFWNFYLKEEPIDESKISKIGTTVLAKPEEIEALKGKSYTLPDSENTPYETLILMLKDLRCVSDIEKYLCDSIGPANKDPWGVAQRKLMLNVIVDGTPYLEDARKHVPLPRDTSQPSIDKYLKDVEETAIASFIVYAIPSSLNYELLKDYNLTFALSSANGEKVEVAATISPEALKLVKESLTEKTLYGMRLDGVKNLEFTRRYYRIY